VECVEPVFTVHFYTIGICLYLTYHVGIGVLGA